VKNVDITCTAFLQTGSVPCPVLNFWSAHFVESWLNSNFDFRATTRCSVIGVYKLLGNVLSASERFTMNDDIRPFISSSNLGDGSRIFLVNVRMHLPSWAVLTHNMALNRKLFLASKVLWPVCAYSIYGEWDSTKFKKFVLNKSTSEHTDNFWTYLLASIFIGEVKTGYLRKWNKIKYNYLHNTIPVFNTFHIIFCLSVTQGTCMYWMLVMSIRVTRFL
jgi:hypothetical protein